MYAAKALALKDRLPARDQLYLDAWNAQFGPPGLMLEKWRLLAKLYPDYYAASYNYAFGAWQLEKPRERCDRCDPARVVRLRSDARRGVLHARLHASGRQSVLGEAEKNFNTAFSASDDNKGSFYAYLFYCATTPASMKRRKYFF